MNLITITIDADREVVVPREPTAEMCRAGVEAGVAAKTGWCPPAYRAMLEAAPKRQQAAMVAHIGEVICDVQTCKITECVQSKVCQLGIKLGAHQRPSVDERAEFENFMLKRENYWFENRSLHQNGDSYEADDAQAAWAAWQARASLGHELTGVGE